MGNRIIYLAKARTGRSGGVGSLRTADGIAGQGMLSVAAVASAVGARLVLEVLSG